MNARLAFALFIVTAACGTGGPYQSQNHQYSGGSDTGAYESEAGGPAEATPSAAPVGPAPSTRMAVQESDAAGSEAVARPEQPRERPGLGTVFGETRNSYVRMRRFERATTSPFATVAIHYNDASGVYAHLGYLGNERLAPFRTYTPHGGITVALTDEYGNELPGGTAQGRALVVGAESQRYNIVLTNQTGGRYEIVASVDGLDVIDGRPADVNKRGYILEPQSTLVIDGFRKSEYEVAAFRFGRVSESYAARTSGDRNVGVIGVAVFAERGSVWTTDELYRRDTANPFPGDRSYARPPSY